MHRNILLAMGIVLPMAFIIPVLKPKTFTIVCNPFQQESIVTNPEDLLKVAMLAHKKIRYLRNKKHLRTINSLLCPNQESYINEALHTLSFLIKTLVEDKGKAVQRIHDPTFINKHFNVVQWSKKQSSNNSKESSQAENTIHLTKYLTYLVTGSNKKTATFSRALYAIPLDEQNMSEQQISGKQNTLLRFRYTRHEIHNGALDKKEYAHLVRPLVWLKPEDAAQAVMQGSVVASLPNNVYKILHVHRTNGHPYYNSKEGEEKNTQYWFFHEHKVVSNPNKPIDHYVDPTPYITLAGDISQIGLGRVIALRYPDKKTKKITMRLGILIDTGGRFRNNLTTLDCYAGVFPSKNSFYKSIQHLPTNPQAYILIGKRASSKKPEPSK